MAAHGIPKLSDGVITLTFFAPSDAPFLLEADGDAEHRRRFDFPDDFAPSLQHSENVIARWEQERLAGVRFAFAVRSVADGELLGGCNHFIKHGACTPDVPAVVQHLVDDD